MALLQAQLVQADVGDDPSGVDRAILGQLVLNAPFHRLGGDPRASGHVLGRAPDQRPEHELLEAEGIGRVLALEGRDDVLAEVTPRTAMGGGLVDPEAGLAPDVEVPDGLGSRLELEMGPILMPTTFATAALGQGPADLEAVSLLVAFIAGNLHTWGQVHLDRNVGHGSCPGGRRVVIRMPSPESAWGTERDDNPGRQPSQTPRKPSASRFITEEPSVLSTLL